MGMATQTRIKSNITCYVFKIQIWVLATQTRIKIIFLATCSNSYNPKYMDKGVLIRFCT